MTTSPTSSGFTDPTTTESEPGRYWTTANIGEATPDVLSPLCWSFWGPTMEAGGRLAYCDFGILSRRELAVPTDPNQLLTAHFFGRPAMNIDFLRPLFGTMPGVTADDFERDICGRVRPGLPAERRLRRLPVILAKAPVAMARTPGRLRAMHADQQSWWQREVRDRSAVGDPRVRLVDAADRFRTAFHIHVTGRFGLMAVQGKLTKLATSANAGDLLMPLLTGLGGIAETALADDLWEASRGRLSIDEFVRRHGFHGPFEGNLTGRAWREDPTPVAKLLDALRTRPDSERPREREATNTAQRSAAVTALLGRLPAWRRRSASRACAALVRATQYNELGKAGYLMALDGGRAAARDLGRLLVDGGELDEVDDVFYFTLDELRDGLPVDARGLVAFRRSRREEYRRFEMPVTFTGTPTPIVRDLQVEADADVVVAGAAGAAGSVEGPARVVLDPDDDLEPGEVLVCRFTDPSWTPVMMIAAGLVIDIGGPASHGAIVARELGVPCVIGTNDGTARIRTGDLVRLDGTAGTVTVLKRGETS
jgi:pyruvate,water dikinase